MRAVTLLAVALLSTPVMAQAPYLPSAVAPAPLGGAKVTGQITGIVGPTLQLTLRDGRIMAINLRSARAHSLVPPIYPGEFLQVQGRLTGPATMVASAAMRAKSAPAAWPPDIP